MSCPVASVMNRAVKVEALTSNHFLKMNCYHILPPVPADNLYLRVQPYLGDCAICTNTVCKYFYSGSAGKCTAIPIYKETRVVRTFSCTLPKAPPTTLTNAWGNCNIWKKHTHARTRRTCNLHKERSTVKPQTSQSWGRDLNLTSACQLFTPSTPSWLQKRSTTALPKCQWKTRLRISSKIELL